jgi:hypothetical protein
MTLSQGPEADQRAGETEEGLVYLRRPLVADAQTPILSNPGKRPFDYPALAAETGAVGSHASRDQRPDPLAAECLPMRL